jgi:hypothetical protein
LIGIQLSEKYKENFDVSSEGLSSGEYSEGLELLAKALNGVAKALLQ